MIKLKYIIEKINKESDDMEVETNPSEKQLESGIYKKGHLRRDGFEITIENKKNSTREGTDEKGKEWSVKMNNDYGYLKGTIGKDKDHLDAFLSSDYEEGLPVYIVNQTVGNKFDEHKIMMGFKNKKNAEKAYKLNFNRGDAHFSDIIQMDMDIFKEWSKKKSLTSQKAKDNYMIKLKENKYKKYELDILPGDIILTGKFRNKPVIVKSFSKDDNGQPIIITDTGKKVKFLSVRIQKLMPKKKND